MKASHNCPFSAHGICATASRLANVVVPLNEPACGVCVNELVPMAPNKVTASLAVYALQKRGKYPDPYLLQLSTGRDRLAGHVVERRIGRWLRRFRIKPPVNCGCEGWVSKLNRWGLAESLNHVDDIVDQMIVNLKQTYLAGFAVPFLTKPLLRRMVKSWLSKELLLSPSPSAKTD